MIRLAIAEDHKVVAESLATMLSFEQDVEVVGVAASGEDAVALVAERTPDVVLMDLSLDGMDGFEATRRIRAATPATRVLVLTMHDDADAVTGAVGAGADGFVPKNVSRDDLLAAVRAVASGEGWLHPSVTRAFLDRVGPAAGRLATPERLTEREQEVLALLADGQSNSRIAESLGVGEETVKTHLTRIYQKLGASDRTQAVAIALRRGLIQ